MLYAAFFAAVLLFIFGLLSIPFEKKSQIESRVEKFLLDNQVKTNAPVLSAEEEKKRVPFKQRVLLPLWLDAKKNLSKRMPGKKAEKLEKQLSQAGNPFNMRAADYRLLQLAFDFGMPFIAVCYGLLLGFRGGTLIIVASIGIGIGILLPKRYMKIKIAKRQSQAVKELPDFVDLLLVSLEAGLGFDSALSKVIGKQEGVLAREFRRCLEEMRLGLTRKEALSGVRDRLEAEEITVFINSILRGEKLGTGMVKVLRILAVDVRERRREKAEETAQKAPIKMLFPLVFFIFPSLFIVILGPAVIQIFQQFSK
ncbi:type II secretion system F family protein [Neobacillus kokaensis]|uniref:Type II secretion system protein n=1 Tax=Neobacillus kokaensis TaxID=2759023 RepID=A0ABQ3MZ76_9BACI|nr:type II secretion system F family protein [Neobacillus kokaensis]GHH96697.1 type II secretion system protein [Neobacillus kokaensis]